MLWWEKFSQWNEWCPEPRCQSALCTLVSPWQPNQVLHHVSLHGYHAPTLTHTHIVINTSRSSGILTYAGFSWYVTRHSSQPTTSVWCSCRFWSTTAKSRTTAPLLLWVHDWSFLTSSALSQLTQHWFLPTWASLNPSILCFYCDYVHFVRMYGGEEREFCHFLEATSVSLVTEDVCTQKEDYLDLIRKAGGTPSRTAVTYQKCVSTCVLVCVLLSAIVISW